MIPEIGQHVKCILRTGAMVEGTVENWGNEVQLKSLDGESILIIPHANEDIILIKIMIDKPIEEISEDSEIIEAVVESRGVKLARGELEHKYQEAAKLPIDDPDRIKTLAELRIMMVAQEKKIITEKLKNHYPGSAYDLGGKKKYGYPGLGSKPRTK